MVDVESWTRRLIREFSEGGIVGHRLMAAIQAEKDHSAWVTQTFRGHLVLFDSFQSFALETFELAEASCRQSRPPFGWYHLLVAQVVNFRRLRACEILLLRGYPLTGYALLRDLKDQALFFGALGLGVTTIERLDGLHELRGKDMAWERDKENIRRHRQKEEKRVRDLMIGCNSSLDQSLRQQIDHWESLFHLEVHGSRLSTANLGIRWLSGEIPLPAVPRPNMDSNNMYLNRVNEIGWMLLRTYALLQFSNGSFGPRWAKRWSVLDISFREAISVLKERGNAIACAVIHLIDKSFSFAPESTSYQQVKENNSRRSE